MAIFGKEAFIDGLKALGYDPQDRGDNRVSFQYAIAAGRFKDQVIMVGVEVPPDFNVTCPSGPHIFPRLIPMNPQPLDNSRSADSGFGSDWQYLSRPFLDNQEGWNRTKREVKTYLWHIKRILESL